MFSTAFARISSVHAESTRRSGLSAERREWNSSGNTCNREPEWIGSINSKSSDLTLIFLVSGHLHSHTPTVRREEKKATRLENADEYAYQLFSCQQLLYSVSFGCLIEAGRTILGDNLKWTCTLTALNDGRSVNNFAKLSHKNTKGKTRCFDFFF